MTLNYLKTMEPLSVDEVRLAEAEYLEFQTYAATIGLPNSD